MGIAILPRLPLLTFMLLNIWSAHVFGLPRYRNDPEFQDGEVQFINLSGLGEVAYRAEPAGRGTAGIVLSCSATYIFCVWTSLHPNILLGKKLFGRACYKVVLTIMAILVPQAMMICAVGELWKAYTLKKKWEAEVEFIMRMEENEARDVQKALKKLKKKLTLEAAFFVVMGGFLVNRSRLTAWKMLEEKRRKKCLWDVCRGFFGGCWQRAKKMCGRMPQQVSEQEVKQRYEQKVKDKGKALTNASAQEQKWWNNPDVEKLILKNKTAHYMSHHVPDPNCCEAHIRIHYPKQSNGTPEAGDEDKTTDSIGDSAYATTRPPQSRSHSSASCRVAWVLSKNYSRTHSCGEPITYGIQPPVGGAANTKVTEDKPVDITDLGPGSYSTVLTPAGLIHCLKHGQIDDNSFYQSDIDDKGSSSIIGKILALAQALWLVVQSFARWQNEPALPLTLLEVHVLLQVACAGFTYFCWWSKPMGVAEPIVVKLIGEAPNFNTRETIMEHYNKSKNARRKNHDAPHFITTRKSSSPVLFRALSDVISQLSPDLRGAEKESMFALFRAVMSEVITGVKTDTAAKTHQDPMIVRISEAMPKMTPICVTGLLLAALGALHFVASGVELSSLMEEVLWEVSCAVLVGLPFVVLPVLHSTQYHEDIFRKIWEFPYQERDILTYTLAGIHEICASRRNTWRYNKKTVSKDEASGEAVPGEDGSGKKVSGNVLVDVIRITFHYILFVLCINILIAALISSLYLTVESYLAMRSPPAGSFQTPRWSDWLPHV